MSWKVFEKSCNFFNAKKTTHFFFFFFKRSRQICKNWSKIRYADNIQYSKWEHKKQFQVKFVVLIHKDCFRKDVLFHSPLFHYQNPRFPCFSYTHAFYQHCWCIMWSPIFLPLSTERFLNYWARFCTGLSPWASLGRHGPAPSFMLVN